MVATSAFLSGMVPLLILTTTLNTARSSAWVITLAIIFWSGFRLAQLVAKGEPRLFEFMLWLFTYVFFGLAPTIQIRLNAIPSTTPHMPPSIDLPAALVAAAFVLIFELTKLRAPRVHRRPVGTNRRVSAANSRWLIVLVSISFLTLAYRARLEGFLAFFQARDIRNELVSAAYSDASLRYIITASSWIPLVVAAVGLWNLYEIKASPQHQRKYIVAAWGCIIVAFLVTNPINSARYTSGIVIFVAFCMTGAFHTRIRVRRALSILILAMLFLFPVMDMFRRTLHPTHVPRLGLLQQYASNGDYDAFWQIGNTLLFVSERGVTWGRQLLGTIAFPVPSSLWSTKPGDTGRLLATFRGYVYTNLSAPWPAEMIINGGIPVFIIGTVILCRIICNLDQDLLLAHRPAQLPIWAVTISPYLLILLRGSLLQATGKLVLILACIAIVSLPINESNSLYRTSRRVEF